MILKAFITAFQFLTIIPIRTGRDVTEEDLHFSVVMFPVVGAFQGVLLATVAFFIHILFPNSITSIFLLLIYLVTTGGFHQDGISDTFDALSIKSTGDKKKDQNRCIEVMKDSTTGPMGVMAIFFSLMLKFLFIQELFAVADGSNSLMAISIMPVISKTSMVWAMGRAKGARDDGLGKTFLDSVRSKEIAIATIVTIATGYGLFFITKFIMMNHLSWIMFSFFFVTTLAVLYASISALKKIFMNKFGGLTGDNFGAIHEISESLYLTLTLVFILC